MKKADPCKQSKLGNTNGRCLEAITKTPSVTRGFFYFFTAAKRTFVSRKPVTPAPYTST